MDAVMADVTDVPGAPVTDATIRAAGPPGRRSDHRPRPRRGVRNDQLRGGHGNVPPIASGVPCRGFHRWRSGCSRAGGPSGAHRALERRHLRSRGRRHREPGVHVAVDVVRRRRRAQANRRRRDRVRRRPPGARGARRRGGHPGRQPRRQGRHPRGVPRAGPPDQRRRHRTCARGARWRGCASWVCERGLSGARDRHRRVPPRRGGTRVVRRLRDELRTRPRSST